VKVFLDTNVLVSAIATRGVCADILHIVVAEHELLVGETVRKELRRVLRDKLHLPANLITEFDDFLKAQGTLVPKAEPLPLKLRDATDVAIVSEALAGGADVLVSGDRDLLEIPAPRGLKVVNPRGFWDLLRSQHG
jgi:putative PIN family toxin of toxin-antitoxin system